MRISWLQVLTLLGVLAVTPAASAEDDYSRFDDPFRIYLGGFWPEIDSEIAINGEVAPPVPPIGVEDFLGVEDSKGVAWGGVGWRFAKRHSLEFEYFSLNRHGTKSGTYSPPIQIGDTFIESGEINTFYDTSLSRLTYGFSLIDTERSTLQFKAGLHVANLATGIQLGGQICDPTTLPSSPPGCPVAGTGTEFEDITAPLPHIGGSYAYAMTPSLALNLQALGFAIEIDSIEGSIFEIAADVAWQPWRHFGLGAGFRYFKSSVKSGNLDLNGKFNFDYLGPAIYVHATF